jgi:hypothetical protein
MNAYFSRAKLLLLAAFLVFGHNPVSAQQKQWQNWNSITIKVPMSKKIDFSLTELGSFTPSNDYSLNFTQTSAALSVDLTRQFSLKFGDQVNYIPGGTNKLRNRIFIRGSFDNKFNRILKAEHSLQAELHGKNETRYRQRFIFINRLTLRHRFSPLNLRPYVSYSLYYNMGGTPIQYYDNTGHATVEQTPDGFHRGRLYAGLNSKISNHVQLSLYYMSQSEFNFLTPEEKKINVLNPSTGMILRPFDDYNVIGLSLHFALNNDN